MTRKKVKLAFIANDSSRRTTFRKRKNGLLKKLNEITTLCDIPACAIMYSPYDVDPVVWPSRSGVQNVVAEFRSMPEIDQQKKMVDQETFLQQRIEKATELLKRQRRETREREMTEVMFHCLIGSMGTFSLNIRDLNDLGYVIDQFRKDVKHRLEIMKNSGMEIGESSNAAPADTESANEPVGTITVVPTSTAPTAPTAMVSEAGSSSSSAAFLNPIQHHQYQYQHEPQPQPQFQSQPQPQHQPQRQQFHYPPLPHVGFHEQPQNLNLSQNQNENQQQWFTEMLNHSEQMSYVAEQMGFTFMDDNHRHLYHHQPQQHQQIPGESFTAPTTVSNSIVSVTTNRTHHYQLQPQPQPQPLPQPQPQQQIPEDSSTAPASASSNLWFR